MFNDRYSCKIFIKLESSRYIFEKYSNIKFRDNQSIASRVVLCGRMKGRTDGHT